MEPETLDIAQAAIFLQVSQKTVLRALRSGRMPGAKVGGRWRISRELLQRYLAGAWRPPTAPVQR